MVGAPPPGGDETWAWYSCWGALYSWWTGNATTCVVLYSTVSLEEAAETRQPKGEPELWLAGYGVTRARQLGTSYCDERESATKCGTLGRLAVGLSVCQLEQTELTLSCPRRPIFGLLVNSSVPLWVRGKKCVEKGRLIARLVDWSTSPVGVTLGSCH